MSPGDLRHGPIPDSYWLIEGKLLAGEYPGTYIEADTREKLAKFLDAGIRTFIDLTEERELSKYDHVLQALADDRGVEAKHVRQPIRDYSVPTARFQMVTILATIREEIDAGRPVYVHCWGGIGRTGTVVGCWLVEQGRSDSNIRFDDLGALLRALGFSERTNGSHHIFSAAGVEELVNLQRDGNNAKAYQVRQVRRVVVKYNLRLKA